MFNRDMTTTLLTDKQQMNLDGMRDGRSDREKCLTDADVQWYARIAIDQMRVVLRELASSEEQRHA